MAEVPTYTVQIKMAGDIETAKRFLRGECYREGLCVTIEPTTFLYTGGEEAGFVAGLLNYPRFPAEPFALFARALRVAEALIPVLNQRTALLVAADKTCWVKIEPPGARS